MALSGEMAITFLEITVWNFTIDGLVRSKTGVSANLGGGGHSQARRGAGTPLVGDDAAVNGVGAVVKRVHSGERDRTEAVDGHPDQNEGFDAPRNRTRAHGQEHDQKHHVIQAEAVTEL